MAKKTRKDGFVGSLFPEFENESNNQPQKAKKNTLKDKLNEKDAELQRLQQQYAELKEENDLLKKQNNKLQIKAEAFDELLLSESLFPTNIVAKSFGWSAIKLNQYLHEKKIQYKHGDVWVLYQQYASKGYTREMWYNYGKRNDVGRDLHRAHTYWTMKGIMFIRELLKKNGDLPE